MKREIVNSSIIESIGYGRYSSKLEVEFSNWEIIQYLKVPVEIYESLISSYCFHTFFENFIKNVYDFRNVNTWE